VQFGEDQAGLKEKLIGQKRMREECIVRAKSTNGYSAGAKALFLNVSDLWHE